MFDFECSKNEINESWLVKKIPDMKFIYYHQQNKKFYKNENFFNEYFQKLFKTSN